MMETIETAVDSNVESSVQFKPAIISEKVELKQQNFITTDEIVDWKRYNFDGKVITDSMIVEVSSFDSKSTSFIEEDEKSKEEILNLGDQKIEKNEFINKESPKKVQGKGQAKLGMVITSTPKKRVQDEQLDGKGNTPRTPLVVISNSPLVCNTEANNNHKLISKKKKVANNPKRRLPKAPSTPMTPLVKSQQAMKIGTVDKENF